LQDRWAALLSNAADSDPKAQVLPAYVEILRQLAANHALLLDTLYDLIQKRHIPIDPYPELIGITASEIPLGRDDDLFGIYSHLGFTRLPAHTVIVGTSPMEWTDKRREDLLEFKLGLTSFCRETLKPLRHKARLAIWSARIVDLKPQFP